MISSFRRFDRFSWIALVAIFALAFVPTISRVLAGGGGNFAWAELCSANPAEPGADAARDGAGVAPDGHSLNSCALCVLGGAGLPLPAAVLPAFAFATGSAEPPVRVAPAPAAAPAWTGAGPRAPPMRA